MNTSTNACRSRFSLADLWEVSFRTNLRRVAPQILAGALLFAGQGKAGAEPEFITDKMTDDELRAYRDAKVAERRRIAATTSPERTPDGKRYQIFYCSIYYTPKESGFTAERGFDVTAATAPGLRGRTFPQSFLDAVKKEGFGRMKQPVGGKNYLRYVGGGSYGFAQAPLGSRGNVLVPRKSCAISTRSPYLRHQMNLLLDSPTVREVLGSSDWEVCDVGGGVHPLQIDLYWGEDEPLGAVGRNRARPAGTRMEYAFDVVVTAKQGSPNRAHAAAELLRRSSWTALLSHLQRPPRAD